MSEMCYYPYGEARYGTAPTDFRFTGQRHEAGLGLYDYGARYYDPALGRFIQADTIVPGAASGAGGGAATLGYDSNTRLTPLTVNLGEFAAQVNDENREVLQFGAFFQWSSKTRQQHNVPMGPANPQALNRYSYALNNPLRYVDPTGHYLVNNIDVDLTAEQVQALLGDIDLCLDIINLLENGVIAVDSASWVSEVAGTLGISAQSLISDPAVLLRVATWTGLVGPGLVIGGAIGIGGSNSIANAKDDLNDLRYILAMASNAGKQGVHLRMGTNLAYWGIEVNGQEAVGHWNLPLGVPGMLFSRGQANLMPALANLWWHFGYQSGYTVYLPLVQR